MIKKARDLKPGDVVDGKRLITVYTTPEHFVSGERERVHVSWSLDKGCYTEFSPDRDIWVDDPAPCPEPCEPVEKGSEGPFYVSKSRHVGNDGEFSEIWYHVERNGRSFGRWMHHDLAESAADYLNHLFASQRPRIVTKRAGELEYNDQVVLTVSHRGLDGRIEFGRDYVTGSTRRIQFCDVEEVRVIED